jgi:hygromycin-B 7''-O-kinase
MQNSTLLTSITTFEEFERLKSITEIFESLAQEILLRHQLPQNSLTLFSEGTNILFAYGESKVIKIFPPFHLDQYTSDSLVLKHLQDKLSVKTPTIEHEGEIEGWPYIIMTKLEGTLLETLWEGMGHTNKLIIIRQLGTLIKQVHTLPTNGLEAIDCHWEQFIDQQIAQVFEHHKSKDLPQSLLQQLPSYIEPVKESLKQIKSPVLLTGEYTPMNFLVKQVGRIWNIDGLLDFGDAMLGLPEYDLLGPIAFLVQGDKLLLEAFLTSYGYSPEMLTQNLSHKLTALVLLHKHSNLNVQVRIPDWKKKAHNIKDLERLLWEF